MSSPQTGERQGGVRSRALADLRLDWLAAGLAFLVPLAFYLRTACGTIYNLDSAELSAAAYSLGLPHPTGYPLYLLLGRMFISLLPVGDVGFRMNALSAVFGALTVGLVYQLGRRDGLVHPAALSGALFLAVSYYFWAEAVVAEVYTLHTALMAGLLLLLWQWDATRDFRWLAGWALLYGLSFGNHMATVLLAPAFAAFILATDTRGVLIPRRLAGLGLLFVLGLSVYLYLPLRYLARPAFNYVGHFTTGGTFVPVDLMSSQGIAWMLSGQPFRGVMLSYGLAELPGEALTYLFRLFGNFGPVGLAAGLVGATAMIRRAPRRFASLALAFAANALFFIDYRVVDKEMMFLPTYLVWAIWIAWGVVAIADWLQTGDPLSLWERARVRASKVNDTQLGVSVVAGVFLLAAGLNLVRNFSLVDVHDDRRARLRGETVLSRVEPDAMVVGWWASAPVLDYLQVVEGRRPDVTVINRFLISPGDLRQLITRQAGRKPVYLAEEDKELFEGFRVQREGELYRLLPPAGLERGLTDEDASASHVNR
jgi:hypothetical protein